MVRPIDVQDNLAKTPAAERVNQIAKAAPDLDQRQAELVAKEQTVRKQREAQQLERTDEVLLRREHEKSKDDGKQKRKRKRKGKRQKHGLDLTG